VVETAEILVLSATEMRKLLTMRDIIDAVEEAFRAFGKGTCKIAPIVSTMIDQYEGEHEIKSGYIEGYCIGTKIVTFYKHNLSQYGIPALAGVVILNDLKNGRPEAILDGTYITATRTGAAGAVAAKYLARKNSQRVAIIGTGTQGRSQLAALTEVFAISEVNAYDSVSENAARYVNEMSQRYGFKISQSQSAEKAVKDTDIIVTVTPSTKPIIMSQWCQEGVHINAIGADSPGKQELDPAILTRAKVVVDNLTQCMERGEIQTAIKLGKLKKKDVYAELSEIVLGRKPGRTDPKEMTVFDATGMSIQDITTAYTLVQLAKKNGAGTIISLD
jgi:alanine dehydrogenase